MLAFFHTLSSCHQDDITHLEKHSHISEKEKISYAEFKQKTGIVQESIYKKLSTEASTLTARNGEDPWFLIDTLDIKPFTDPRTGLSSYSFKVYPLNQPLQQKVFYNLVYYQWQDQWQELYFRVRETDHPQHPQDKYQSAELLLHINMTTGEAVSMSSRTFFYVWYHCTGCMRECDNCPICITTFAIHHPIDPSNQLEEPPLEGSDLPDLGGGGGGGVGYGIFIPNPYNALEIDIDQPAFQLVMALDAFVAGLPPIVADWLSHTPAANASNHYSVIYLRQSLFYYFQAHGFTSQAQDSVRDALINLYSLHQQLQNAQWQPMQRVQFEYWALNHLLEGNQLSEVQFFKNELELLNHIERRNVLQILVEQDFISQQEALVKGLLKTKPNLLIDPPCSQIQKWIEVANYTIPEFVINRVQANRNAYNTIFPGNWEIQHLTDATGAIVNMDLFSITISQFPHNAGTNQVMTPQQFFEIFRTNLNYYLSGNSTNFSAYNDYENNLWLSSNYLGAFMRFEIQVNSLITDNGSVVCSQQALDKWKFTTIRSPLDWGHPVSGHREFGYYQNPNGHYVFYTRGVDRVDSWIFEDIGNNIFENSHFDGADSLWNTMIHNLSHTLNSPGGGGSAVINTTQAYRPNWNQVEAVLNGDASVSTLPGFQNCP
ncbi:MAG: hypothetical protein Q4F57_06340 [Weeksellaceae bacterium]|nr:hypothetical protein [Weeksellaceae bacterium]